MSKRKPNTQDGFYRNLYENYTGLLDHLNWLHDMESDRTEEMRYLTDFIHYKRLDDEFEYFRKNAHEEDDPNVPFPSYIL